MAAEPTLYVSLVGVIYRLTWQQSYFFNQKVQKTVQRRENVKKIKH